jgi:hypothetical protein
MLAKVTASDAFSEAERKLKLAATGIATGFYRLVPPFWNAECGMRNPKKVRRCGSNAPGGAFAFLGFF